MKWYVLLTAVMSLALLVGCSGLFDTAPEVIDGGTRHYVDEEAPKAIQSTTIVSFSCEFTTTDIPMNESPIAGRYYTLYAAEDSGSFEARGGGEVFAKREFTPDAEFLDAVQEIVAKYDFAQYNGQFYTVAGLPPDLGVKLEIYYDSGESIRASDNQSRFIPPEAMEELVELFYPQAPPLYEQE